MVKESNIKMEEKVVIDLLQQINDGKKSFKPKTGDFEGFQKIARALVYMIDQGFIEAYKPSREKRTGNDFYVAIFIKNITYKGEKILKEYSEQKEIEESPQEIKISVEGKNDVENAKRRSISSYTSFPPQDIANLAQSCIDNFLTKETADYALLKIGINPASIQSSPHTLTYYVNMIQYLSSRGQLENWLSELSKEGLTFAQEWLEK